MKVMHFQHWLERCYLSTLCSHRAQAGESMKLMLFVPVVVLEKQQDIRVASQLIMVMDSSATSTSRTKVVVVVPSTNRCS
ncbi:hypothetical protein L1987_09220 [Smallanthus sonchifolius]|uniref:Uncharacterized protein n=1 Tax=Smallanthus sonchifolius TaxID=185202 RepID=A0ACB9JP96_9ASTR|nr:hypothetical protein L1987_09220 [Smallanthus sonchifolius]